MRCREVRQAVLHGRALSEPALREHLASCACCGTLADELSRVHEADEGPSAAELEPLLRRVENAIADEKGLTARLRSMPTRWRLVLAGSAAFVLAIALGLVSPRCDITAYPRARLVVSAGAFVLLLGALIVLNLRPLQRPEVSSRTLVFVFIALTVPFLISLLPEAALSHSIVYYDAHDCLLAGGVCGGALMALLRVLDRSTGDTRALLVPAAAGGVLANLALSFHCPVVSPLHLALIHAPIGIVLYFGYKGIRATRWRIAPRTRQLT